MALWQDLDGVRGRGSTGANLRSGGADQTVVELHQLLSRSPPRERARRDDGRLREGGLASWIRKQGRERPRVRLWAGVVHYPPRHSVANDMGKATDSRSDDRDAAGLGLERGQPKGLIAGAHD